MIIFFDVLMCITIAVPTPYFKIFFSRQTLENLKMLFLSVLHHRNQSVREANPKQNTVLDISHQPPSAQTFPIVTTYVFIRLEWLQPLKNQGFCTDLISNTHKDSHESRPCMLPALHFKDAMLKTVLSVSQVIQFCLHV